MVVAAAIVAPPPVDYHLEIYVSIFVLKKNVKIFVKTLIICLLRKLIQK